MPRLTALVFAVALLLGGLPVPGQARQTTDAGEAAAVAVELSRLEATGDFNTLYDRIHPDAHAVIPRAAVIGWYEDEFAPRGPSVSTVTSVTFGEWTWPVTGQTYPYTAEVSFEQPFADGTVAEDVVRLVQDRNGEWRWFFGRSLEFVEDQIARYSPPLPPAIATRGVVDVAVEDIDVFWGLSFEAAGQRYVPPSVVAVEAPIATACGAADPYGIAATYCPSDQTIYYAPLFFAEGEARIGDFAWITVLAHEWGHHVQTLLAVEGRAGNAFELQADCLAGSYARDAGTRGLLESGDVSEAVAMSASAGDPPWLPQDEPGAHGTNDDRITAFMRGYLDGFLGCDLSLASHPSSDGGGADPGARGLSEAADLFALLPTEASAPPGLVVSDDVQRSLGEVAANYADPAETERRFITWGWEANVARSFSPADGIQPLPEATASVYTSLHRFRDAAAAADALNYSLEDQVATTGAREVRVGPVGDYARALAAITASGREVTVYAQRGTVLVRLTAASSAGDPMADALALTRTIVADAD